MPKIMIPKRLAGAIMPLAISGPLLLSCAMRVLTRVAAPAWRQHEGQKPAPRPHVEPVTPTSVSREGHGSVFFNEGSRAQRILAAHAREKCVEEARMTSVMVRKRLAYAIIPLKISGPWFLSSRMRDLNRVAAPAGRPHEGQEPAPKPHVEPVTPTSVSGEGHGSVFFVRDRALHAFWRHMLARSVWTRLGCRVS